MTRIGAASLAVAMIALAACDGGATRAGGNAAAEGEANVAGVAAANLAEPTKSILRPDVVEPAPAPAPLEPVELVVPFGDAGLTLDEAGRALVREALASPAAKAGGRITLRGHSDSRGTDGDNRVASRIRAEAVRDFLVELGVDAARIAVVALGEARPLQPNAKPDGSDDPEGRAKNRRVELLIEVPAPAAPVPSPLPDDAVANGA